MITAAPGAEFTATAAAAPGLVGTIGVAIINSDDQTVFGRITAGITEDPDSPGDYWVILPAPLIDGTYRVRWDLGEISSTTAAEEVLVVGGQSGTVDYTPTLAQVGALLHIRTKAPNEEIGTFNNETRPTGDQVQVLIDNAVAKVHARFGDAIDDDLAGSARELVALRAALMIELSYFGEQIQPDRGPYNALKELYDEAYADLIENTKLLGPDEEPGTDDDELGQGMPASAYPFGGIVHAPGSESPLPVNLATGAW